MTTHHITRLHITTLFVLDQDEAVAFYRDRLGFEVCDDIDLGFMRWLTIAHPSDLEHRLLVSLPGGPMADAETAATMRGLLTQGALGGLFLQSDDVHATYDALVAVGVEITQEPVEQPYGTDIGIRDPFGNHVRISEPVTATAEEIQERYAGTPSGA
ncbi:MAG: glyoxalase [Nocardioides sp.]|nr:glyoxalase [Nocardioides sp.]